MITGKGIFAWDGMERRSDRYGSFTLDKTGYSGNGTYPEAAWEGSMNAMAFRRVKIVVEIITARDSAHVGDLSRGIYPSRPEVGEVIVLGVGKFFCDPIDWSASKFQVGVMPDDGRSSDWFEPAKLYRLHDQTVSVTITETNEDAIYAPETVVNNDMSIIVVQEDDNGGFFQVKGGK
jgi:hypothetical protein